jgi:hypothetical protein
MTLHQDALGSLGDHSAAERALEVWYSANLRSTMSMALCHSSTSESVMKAKIPRFEASLTKGDRGRGSGGLPGTRPPSILSIRARACSELFPRPTSATSGRSLAVTAPTSLTSISRASPRVRGSRLSARRAPADPCARWRSALGDAQYPLFAASGDAQYPLIAASPRGRRRAACVAGCTVGVRLASALGGAIFSGSDTRSAYGRIDLTRSAP